jgi:hypothetical protein
MPSDPVYIAGLDLGQAADFSAFAILEQQLEGDTATYGVRELRRWPLGTPYPKIVEDVVSIYADPRLAGSTLAVDGTGCGRPVVDLFRWSPDLRASLTPILITAGHAVSTDADGYRHVAKLQLVSTMQVLLGTKRLRFADGLSLRKIAEAELATFQTKITPAANETFAAWRENAHDDLVLALAMAGWVGENCVIRPWEVTVDPRSRSVIAQAPPGVFLDEGPRKRF